MRDSERQREREKAQSLHLLLEDSAKTDNRWDTPFANLLLLIFAEPHLSFLAVWRVDSIEGKKNENEAFTNRVLVRS